MVFLTKKVLGDPDNDFLKRDFLFIYLIHVGSFACERGLTDSFSF